MSYLGFFSCLCSLLKLYYLVSILDELYNFLRLLVLYLLHTGPGGDLRVYLEGLALAEDVQKYVEQNSFGQKSITDSDPSWSFYAQVIRSTSRKTRYKPNWKKSNPSLKNRVAPASKCVPV